MSESKLRALGKSSMAILLAFLLGVAVYYASFGGDQIPNLPKPAYAFVWSQGNQQQAFEDYENATLFWHNLGMYFGLANGTTICNGTILPHNPGESCVFFSEGHGSIEALINNITVQPTDIWILTGMTGISSFVSVTTGGPGAENGPIANMTIFENRTFSSTLVTSTTTDMGSYTFRGGLAMYLSEATSTPGYWPDASKLRTPSPKWSISSSRLLEYLEGSGSATIRFDAVFSVHMNYTISFPDNRTETGVKDLVWTGTMGTIEFSYDETGILSVKYDFWQVRLILLVQESE